MRLWLVFLLLSPIGWVSCSDGSGGKAPIEEKKMIDLLVDIHRVDAVLIRGVNQGNIKNDKTHPIYKTVFTKHDVTPQLFDSAFEYYSHDFKRFDNMYKKVVNRLKQQEEALKDDGKNEAVLD